MKSHMKIVELGFRLDLPCLHFQARAQYSQDVTLAWALIGEWTSQVLFPPPVGTWP